MAKVLASQAGVTDGRTVKLVASAAPAFRTGLEPSDRERRDFAEFIRQHVRFEE